MTTTRAQRPAYRTSNPPRRLLAGHGTPDWTKLNLVLVSIAWTEQPRPRTRLVAVRFALKEQGWLGLERSVESGDG